MLPLEIDRRIRSPEEVVRRLVAIEGPADLYFWFEGREGLPRKGADFMKEKFFIPLSQLRRDFTFCLYSLKAWSFKRLDKMPEISEVVEAINKTDSVYKGINSKGFFQYCGEKNNSPLADFLKPELKKKKWLLELSEKYKDCKTKVSQVFKRASLLDDFNTLDFNKAYSLLQYVEGYYLIQESVRRGLEKRQSLINIVFVLPNDEAKYYEDFPEDIPRLLDIDFGYALKGVCIEIRFEFFEYEGLRPYLGEEFLDLTEINQYFRGLI